MIEKVTLSEDVPRRLDADGRLEIPPSGWLSDRRFISADSLLRPVIDVLSKNVDPLLGNGIYDLRLMPPFSVRDPRYGYSLSVPLDPVWLLAKCSLPPEIRVVWDAGRRDSVVINGWNVVYSDHRADSRQWVRAGWKMGEPYDGPIPAPRVHWWQR